VANLRRNAANGGIVRVQHYAETISRFSLSALAAACCALAVPVFSQVVEEDLRLPISLDADSTDYDGKTSMLMFRGLRLSQGNIGIAADEGRATKLDFEDSVWHFKGNVVIDTESGHIECDNADLHFAGHQLLQATIGGSPATFELQRPESSDVTYAEAEQLDYDFSQGIVEFSGNARITEGGNQISSNFLVYNIVEQRINAQSTGTDGERVKITYTPRQGVESPTEDESADDDKDSDASEDEIEGSSREEGAQ